MERSFHLFRILEKNSEKAEEQYLALFPQDGRIIAQAIKIMRKGIVYSLPDNIPVRCLFDGAKGICSLFMDAVTVTPDSAETRMHVSDLCQNSTHGAKVLSLDTAVVGVLSREGVENLMGGGIQISNTRQSQVSGDPSRGRDLIKGSLNQGGNTSCTSEAPKRKFPGGSTYKDPVVEEMIPGVGVLGEFAEGNTKQKKSKDPSSDEVPPSSEGESPKTGVKMHNRSAAPENETAGVHLMSSSLGTWNPDAASADMVVLDAAPEGNGSYNEKENSMALEKEARKEVGEKFDLSKGNTSGSGSSTHMNEIFTSTVGDSPPDFNGKKQNGALSTDLHQFLSLCNPMLLASVLTVMVPDELRCGRNSGPGWRCSKKAKPDSKYCKRHCRRSTSSKKKRPKSTRDTHLMGGGVHISNGEVDNLKKMLKERDQMISGLHAAEFSSRVGPSLPVDSGTSRTLRSGTKRTHESVSRAQPSASQTVSRQQLSRSQGRASVLNAETPRLFSSNFKVPKLKNATITYRTKTAHPK